MAMDQSLDRQTSHTHPNVTLLGGDPSLLLPTSRKKEGGARGLWDLFLTPGHSGVNPKSPGSEPEAGAGRGAVGSSQGRYTGLLGAGGALGPTLAVQEQAVAQDLVHLHRDVRHVLRDGLDPLHEAGPRGKPGERSQGEHAAATGLMLGGLSR